MFLGLVDLGHIMGISNSDRMIFICFKPSHWVVKMCLKIPNIDAIVMIYKN